MNFETDRASVRRWARENHLAPDTRYKFAPGGARATPPFTSFSYA